MPAKYKLIYFNVRARAECSRLLFAQAGVEYEDCRLTSDEFKAIKDDVTKVPLGQLPVLQIDDHPALPQSHAIERYLARSLGLYGKNEVEATRIDVACECIQDLVTPLMKMYFEKDEAKKAEMGKAFVEKDSVAILTAMTNSLMKNSEGKGYFVGDSMTLADIAIFNLFDGLFKHMPPLAEKYPTLKEFDERMRAEPKIAAWLAKRPETAM
uniref:GST_pi-like protein n=1 Tax=Strongylocentrotus droebachiensis TaxID=7671 RepID=M1FAD1_STRDR|nr:GST_pi-like protein [Strongylocentrotus droebachiensis]